MSAYRPDIDGLRAVAVLSVVAFHIREGWLPGGFAGVDMFFVISGYLITGIVARGLAEGRFSLADFYARRVARIFPALALMLALTLGLGSWWLLPSELAALGRHTVFAVGFALNLVLGGEAGYFDTDAALKPLLHLWSLGIEEQFYLAYPLLLVTAMRWRMRPWFLTLLLAAASMAAGWMLSQSDPPRAFFMPWARAWELLLGSGLAFWTLHRPVPVPNLRLRAGMAAVGGMLVAASLVGAGEVRAAWPGWWPLAGCLGTVALIACAPGTAMGQLLSSRSLVKLGLISYPVYLFHWPLLALVRVADSGKPHPALEACAVLLALVLAWLSWRWLEMPARAAVHSGPPAYRRRMLGSWIGAMVLLAGLGALASRGGWPQRPWLPAAGDAESLTRLPASDATCPWPASVGPRRFHYCLAELADAGQAPVVAVIGDSHAHALFPGVAALGKAQGQGTVLLANSSCPPLLDTVSFGKPALQARCDVQIEQILGFIEAQPTLRQVLIVTRGPVYLSGRGYGLAEASYRETPVHRVGEAVDQRDPAEVWRLGLQATVDRLQRKGLVVDLVLQVPELGLDPRVCRHRPFVPTHQPDCARSREDYLAAHSAYRQSMAAISGARVLDLAPVLCQEARCIHEVQGQSLYADDDHLSRFGARWVLQQIQQAKPVLQP